MQEKSHLQNQNINEINIKYYQFHDFYSSGVRIPASNIPAALSCSKALKLDHVAKTKATVVWSAKAVDLISM